MLHSIEKVIESDGLMCLRGVMMNESSYELYLGVKGSSSSEYLALVGCGELCGFGVVMHIYGDDKHMSDYAMRDKILNLRDLICRSF